MKTNAKLDDFQKMCKRNELASLIKKADKLYGDSESEFLDDVIKATIRDWDHNIDAAIECYREAIKAKESIRYWQPYAP